MKKVLKKSFAVLLALICVMNVAVFTASAAVVASGAYGNNPEGDIKWTLDTDGTLTIKGKGEMEDIHNYYNWAGNYAPSIKKVVIEKGITRIGNNAFSGAFPYSDDYTWCCENLTEVHIPDTVESIGVCTFEKASKLEKIYYDGTITQWNAIEIGEKNESIANATVCCKGDINRDGKTNSTDAFMVLQHAVKIKMLASEESERADLNTDKKINSSDALFILQIAVGAK